ncbi:hypothetical protein POTOM_048263 [Populus tomentosa]|uniref:BED-type domain-containing protein n=1 Tax=Populus tomentosa TaxID=118781 RepID=A0A8X7YCT9_POPTO|nr:hypothetical protein POTOM_048263 [Populus tomentosa]
MQGDEDKVLIGSPPNSRPTLSQVKAAYRKKVWESHRDLFPLYEKPGAESRFKLISEVHLQTEMAPLRSSGYIDPGWEHGIAQDERKKKVKCNYCGKIVSGGNIQLQTKGKRVVGDKNLVIRFASLRSLGYVDPGWEHCVAQDEKKKRVKCNYCEKIISGGINRFKQHLARIPGEVAYCDKAPEEVYHRIKENMKWHRTGRRNRKLESKDISAFYTNSDNEEEEEEHEGGLLQYSSKDLLVIDDKFSDNDIRNNIKGRSPGSSSNGAEPPMKRSRLDSVFLKSLKSQTSSHYRQTKAKMGFEKKARKEVISAICKFFYHAGLPSNAANSPYFHKMLELVGQYGPGLQGPSSRLISGRFLQDEITTIKEYQEEFRASWMITGCSIVADSWNDLQEDAASLFKLLDKVVEEIGEENVVQVITKNTASFKAAGNMLEEKRRNLFWTPCAIHCIDQMVEDFLNIKWVGECIDKAKRVTRFIYNNTWLLNYMKKEFTKGQELLRPAVTKYGTTFFTLQSLLDQRVGLKRMFQSNKWVSSRFTKSDDGREVEKIVLNSTFWKKIQYVIKSLEPVAHVLQKIDSDETQSIAHIYNDMCRAKHAIKAIHGDDARKYGPFWSVIENQWNSLFHHPLYVAAYFLNPSYRYRPDFLLNPEVIRGLNECIVRLEADSGKRVSASMQIPDFVSAKADFGTDLAISTRMELNPAAWWQQHGINCLELQRIAIRMLSQTCSSLVCEHTWSIYDQVHSKRHSSVSRKRWNELTYVHYNLRLRERQQGRKPGDVISFDNLITENILDDWLVESDKQPMQEDEEILYNEMEQFDGDVMDENDHQEKRPADMVTLAGGVLEPLDVIPAAGGVTTDDDGLDFLDDDLTD